MTETQSSTLAETLAQRFPWPRPVIDPPDAYAQLRAENPVVRVTLISGQQAWLITRYDDVRAILADPRVSADTRKPGFPSLGYQPSEHERPFLRMDPPEHTVFRRLLSKNFMVKRVESLRPDIQRLVDKTIDAMLARPERPVDLVEHLALPVPSTVLSWILGVRAEDRVFFNKVTEALMNGSDVTDPQAMQRFLQAIQDLNAYTAEVVAEKQAQEDPGDDILGQLVRAAREGTVTHQDILNTGLLFVLAGYDTTANMTALGTLTLLQHPDQLAELRANPALIPAAIEELLRYLTIVNLIVLRVAAEPIEIGGQVIPAGDGIIPLNISANRDDAHYPDAATFDIHRGARDHFAFGHGVHQCIGQPLARVELHVIFETLLRRIPTLSLAVPVEEIPFKIWSPINGVFRLPVTW
ncbi:cytochrome P450 [Streptosporangium sp. NPDC005286]|uniref:cytochrome P450 n=1 Tax=Streptosporangium sp. NPDC005286 TaxID=3154463 RepID=UPI0033AD68CD